MDQDASSNSYSMRNEEQKEQLYCSGPQNPEDVICEGSDTEQTAEEIAKKRRRYEEVARRYLCGRRPQIQSASLRGPFNQESGWVNPWRYRPREEADWWQPGSENMLFTRENVMRRAADHGLGYLNPSEALAWCKAAAEAEARKEFDQFDSLEVVHYSSELDLEDRDEESPTDSVPQGQPAPTSKADGHQPSPDHSTKLPTHTSSMVDTQAIGMANDDFTHSTRAAKRPAESQWLKGSYVSKKARWEDPPLSSPTPMPDQHSERDRRHRQSSVRSTGSENGRLIPIPQLATPCSHDAQQRGTVSQYSGSTAQGVGLKDSWENIGQQAEDLDGRHEDSRETNFISVPSCLPGSREKIKEIQSMDRLCSDLEPNDLTVISVKRTSLKTPAAKSGTSVSRRSGSGSNQLPKLPPSSRNSVDPELVEADSFITEVAPSSRNLEKFQYRRKRRKSKKHQSEESREGSHDQLENISRSPSGLGPADGVEEASSRGVSVTIDSALARGRPELSLAEKFEDERRLDTPQSPVGSSTDEVSIDSEWARGEMKRLGATLSPEEELTRMQNEALPGSRQSDESYFKKLAMMSINVLPSLQITSPFALFAPFSTSKPIPTPKGGIANRSTWEMLQDDVQNPASNRSENIQLDDTLSPSLVPPENHDPVTNYSESPVESLLESRPSNAAAKTNRLISLEHHQQIIDAPTPERDIVPIRSSTPQYATDLEDALPSLSLPASPEKWQAVPKPKGRLTNLTQETNIDDGSTQSFNSTAPHSLRELYQSPAVARTIPIADEDAMEDHETKVSNESNYQTEISGGITHNEAFNLHDDTNAMEAQIMEAAVSPAEKDQDEMEIIQNTLSQDCRGFSSRNSTQSEKAGSTQLSVSAAITEPEPGRTTPLDHDDEAQVVSANEEQDSWQGCGPQSPWASENLIPEAISSTNQHAETFVIIEREMSADIGSSPPPAKDEEGSDWQPIERPVTPDNGGITPFKDFMTPTVSPERPEAPLDHDDVSNTQQLIEAATKNPWTSTSKNHASGKPKKRVSFGVLPPEEKPDSQREISNFSKQRPASPPPPQTSDRACEEDAFDDGTAVINKFGKHFSAAARFKRLLPRNTGSLLSSPHVGAMAEAFIAADRETLIGHKRRSALGESPTQPLRPKSDARTNLSPETTDYNLEVNLDDFLGDAGDFLEDWSVDSEVKKVNNSRGKRHSRSDASKSRSLFRIASGWS